MEEWKEDAFEDIVNNLSRRVDDLVEEITLLEENVEDLPAVFIEDATMKALCPHCKSRAFHFCTALHKCAICRKYYFVEKEE